MTREELQSLAHTLVQSLRLRTLPLAVRFLGDTDAFPEKTRRPSQVLHKRITICQGVTMARNYGWTVGLGARDLICVPALISFGQTRARDIPRALAKLFCEIGFAADFDSALAGAREASFLERGECEALVLSPLAKGLYPPDVVVIYGNPAQVMRLVQAWSYHSGRRVQSSFGGKVECAEYLISPHKTQQPRIIIPGMGDRIFSMTQDDELVFALPAAGLADLAAGLEKAGGRIGARYPITFYQNFQPQFPPVYAAMAEELGLSFEDPE